MQQIKIRRPNFKQFKSIEEFVKEKGWYVPSLHEKYLDLIEKDREIIKREIEALKKFKSKKL